VEPHGWGLVVPELRTLHSDDRREGRMGIVEEPSLEPMVGDPDDHRPQSRWETLADPDVGSLGVIIEEIAPGDRIPLHTHPIDEVILYRSGSATVTIGDDRRGILPGAVAFVPGGTPHRTENVGSEPASLFAVFPSRQVGIRYLERNPAPGTESDDAQAPVTFDFLTGEVLAEG
jgi:quercetin dioxygenase-like cupin family protein